VRLRHGSIFGRYQTNNGQISILTGNGYDAIDPKRTIREAINKQKVPGDAGAR